MNKEGKFILHKNSSQTLYVRYALTPFEGEAPIPDRHLLGGLLPSMGEAQKSPTADDFCFRIPMACLDGEPHPRQWWSVGGSCAPHFSTQVGDVAVTSRRTGDFLFATVSLADDRLDAQTHLAYQVILKLLQDQNLPHLLRMWNFVPRINACDGGVERYRLFNKGRQDAFCGMGYPLGDGAPAACALGTQTGGLHVVVLAGTRPAIAIENPRQVSSYHYPEHYGAQPPIFSRAAWLPQPCAADVLFVSGTASIVGHQTLHAGNVLAQVKEAVRNIEALLDSANQRAGAPLWHLCALMGRVYLRHATDYGLVSSYLLTRGMTRFCFYVADICRSDLLVEIEAEGQGVQVRP